MGTKQWRTTTHCLHHCHSYDQFSVFHFDSTEKQRKLIWVFKVRLSKNIFVFVCLRFQIEEKKIEKEFVTHPFRWISFRSQWDKSIKFLGSGGMVAIAKHVWPSHSISYSFIFFYTRPFSCWPQPINVYIDFWEIYLSLAPDTIVHLS